jgi:hypothetical protein
VAVPFCVHEGQHRLLLGLGLGLGLLLLLLLWRRWQLGLWCLPRLLLLLLLLMLCFESRVILLVVRSQTLSPQTASLLGPHLGASPAARAGARLAFNLRLPRPDTCGGTVEVV